VKEFVAIVAVCGVLCDKKRELVSRNVRKEDAMNAKGKLVEICTNIEIDDWKSFSWWLCRAKIE
jgi:hypothetical protein